MAPRAKKTAAKKKVSRKKQTTGSSTASQPPAETAAAKPAQAASWPASFADLERAFEELLQRRWPRPLRFDWPHLGELPRLLDQQAPSVDVVDKEKEIVVRAELPGVEKDDVDVSIAERTLTIKGSTRKEEKEERDDYVRREIRSGSFSRSVLLPADVNAAKAAASFEDGVLELHLPKVRVAKRKQIPVG